MKYEANPELRQLLRRVVETYFNDPKNLDENGEPFPFEAVEGQLDIFDIITDMSIKRAQIETTTQFGKSLTIGLGALYLAKTHPGIKIPILAPTEKQSHIIMDYIIEHLFDHPAFTEGIINVTGLEKLKTERNRDTLTWIDGSSIKIFTVQAGNTTGIKGKNVMGFGGDVIIVDEANLIPNEHFSKVLRMLGGNLKQSRLIKIGNTFSKKDPTSRKKDKEHHFYKSHKNKNYVLLHIDWRRAVKEGRLTEEYVMEMKDEMTPQEFDALYNVIFPDESNEEGIISENDCKVARESTVVINKAHRLKIMGVDVSGSGSNKTILSVAIADQTKFRLLQQEEIAESGDIQRKADAIHEWALREDVDVVSIDVVGIGKGVADILNSKEDRNYEVYYYIAGARPIEFEQDKRKDDSQTDSVYFNLKSQLVFYLKKLMQKGLAEMGIMSGDLESNLLGFMYVRKSNKKIKSDDPVDSPDYADSVLAMIAGWLDKINTVEPSISWV